MVRMTIIIALLVALSTAAVADYKGGRRAYQQEDFAEALRQWKAAKGYLPSYVHYQMGLIYFEGLGNVAVDKAEAMSWFRRAARAGLSNAQVMLANGYLEGDGVPRDEAKGLKWLRKAARNGNGAARLQLATMYDSGELVPRNNVKALELYEGAALAGSIDAQMILARRYAESSGVDPDPVEAYKWLLHAAAKEHEPAHDMLTEIMAGMSAEELDGCVEQGVKLYRSGRYDLAAASWRLLAQRGLPKAQYGLGRLYAFGRGLLRDPVEAYRWLTLAARHPDLADPDLLHEVAATMSPDEIEEAEALAASWKPIKRPPFEKNPIPAAEDHKDISLPVLIPGSKVEPIFPERYRIEREDGQVTLLAVIRDDGTVDRLSVLRSSRLNSEFETAAINAVSQWRYEPALKDGKPIEVLFTVWVSFTIH